MADFITVAAADQRGAVALWEKNPDHPAGEAYVQGEIVALVAPTPEVITRIDNGLLVVLADDAPLSEPFKGYDGMSAAQVAKRLEELGDIEKVIVRQYEAAHKNRKTVLAEAQTAGENGA